MKRPGRILSINEEICLITSDSRRYVLKNEGGNLVIVQWYEPLCDSYGRQFTLAAETRREA